MEDEGKSGLNSLLVLDSLLCSTQQQGFATKQASNTCQEVNPSQHSASTPHTFQHEHTEERQEITTGKLLKKTGWRQETKFPY